MQLEKDRADFEERGAQIIAVAVQSQENAWATAFKTEAQFPILADRDHKIAEAYGVYNLFNDNLAAASVFVINSDKEIHWTYLPKEATDRAPSETILANLP